jgi:co-chaperonin GroES (HSP10)
MAKIKAISCNCFVKRDKPAAEHNGIQISEGARVKSCYGEIVAIDASCAFAKVGDSVHLPHYGVEDIEYDGAEYAMCKTDRLFFVNGDVVNKYVKVSKCQNEHIKDESGEIALYMTEQHIEHTLWVEVLEVAKDCTGIKDGHIGLFCVSPESDERLARIDYSNEWAIHESLIEFLTEG